MNAYFFKMNKAERNDILDQHRQIYDGYVTTYGQQINQQPLYIQDFANDKGGLVVNNKGVVKPYSNMRINEMRHDGMDTGLFSNEEKEYSYVTPTDEGFDGLDMIGDGPDDLVGLGDEEMDYDVNVDKFKKINPKFNEVNLYELDTQMDDEQVESIEEQVNKTLDMFKRFKKY